MRIALILNEDFPMWQFRKGLICALKNRGHDVLIFTPAGPYVPLIESLGVKHFPIRMKRFFDPFEDLKLFVDLYRLFRSTKVDLVHNMTVKPNIYGALAARLAGVPRVVSLVSGLGFAFMGDGNWKRKLLRGVATWMYWLANKLTDRVWFQNEDDLEFFVTSGLLSREKALLIRSGGINLDEYSPDNVDKEVIERLKADLGINSSTRLVLMVVARVVWSKGVREFIEASEAEVDWPEGVKFLLVGPLAPASPAAVPESYLREKISPRFMWEGFRNEVKEIISLADVFVLPSYYREGIPRVLLEAMAMAKPIVTTDNVGCRETVDDGKNGYLVPVQDAPALASAIHSLVSDDERRREFGRNSREKAKAEFDETTVVNGILSRLYQFDA